MTDDVVLRARSLVGCRFRPQGRDPDVGVDCVGLVCAAFGIPANAISRNYRLRGASAERLKVEMERYFQPILKRFARPGDVLTLRVASDQLHLCIATDRGFIHADARLRHAVETPGTSPWPVLSAHRWKAV